MGSCLPRALQIRAGERGDEETQARLVSGRADVCGQAASHDQARTGAGSGADALAGLRKGAPEKVLIAVLLRERTAVSQGWNAQRLAMGYTGAVSRLTGMFHRDSGNTKRLRDFEEMLE